MGSTTLIVHELVKLGLVNGGYFVVFWIPHNLIGFMDLGLAWFLEWLLDFVQDILSHDPVIQLALAFTVESESPHFTFDFAFLCGVTIILGTTRHEFDDVIILSQFTGKLAEVVAQVRVGLTLVFHEKNRVRVVVQDTFPQLFQCLVQFEPGITGGECSHKDVQVG